MMNILSGELRSPIERRQPGNWPAGATRHLWRLLLAISLVGGVAASYWLSKAAVAQTSLRVAPRGACAPIRVARPTEMVAAGADIWVLGLSSNTVSEISTSTCAVQRVVTVRFPDYPTDLAADGRRVWLASSSGQIIEINNRTGSVDGSLRLPHSGLPVLAVGDGHIWAGDSMFYRGITEIDASTRKVIHTFLRNRASAWLTYEHRRLWSSGHVLVEIDTSSRRILRTFPMPTHSAPQASVFDGRHLWVVAGSRRIVEVDTRSHRVLGAVVAGRNIGGLAFDGRDIWVTSSGTDRVAEVDTVGRRVIKTLAVGRMPAYLVFAAGHLWVSNYGSSTVQELHAP